MVAPQRGAVPARHPDADVLERVQQRARLPAPHLERATCLCADARRLTPSLLEQI